MKRIYFLLLALCFTLTSVDITYEITSINEMNTHIKKAEKLLVVFDIDNTLLEMHTLQATPQWFDAQIHHLRTNHGMDIFAAVDLTLPHYSAALHATSVQLVEPHARDILNSLYEQNIYFLIVTKRSLIDITHRHFESLELIKKSHADWEHLFFDFTAQLPHPAYYDRGIIFVGNNEKGKVLELFLQEVNFAPKCIIAIDDTASHLVSFANMAQHMNIDEFIGLRYGFLDEKVAEYKKNHMPQN